MSPINQPHGDLAVVWGPCKALCPPGGPGCIYKLLTAQPAVAWRQAGSRGLERACWSQPGIYYPASGCRAKVTVTNGLLHACHISSAHCVRLLRSQPCCAGSLRCVPSWGGQRGDPPFAPAGASARESDNDSWTAWHGDPHCQQSLWPGRARLASSGAPPHLGGGDTSQGVLVSLVSHTGLPGAQNPFVVAKP